MTKPQNPNEILRSWDSEDGLFKDLKDTLDEGITHDDIGIVFRYGNRQRALRLVDADGNEVKFPVKLVSNTTYEPLPEVYDEEDV